MKKIHISAKRLVLIVVSILGAIILSKNPTFHALLEQLGNYGYIGAFFAGLLFVSTFTITIAVVILLGLSEHMSPIMISLIAGLGATLGNYIMFRIMEDTLAKDIQKLYKTFKKKRKKKHHIHINTHWTIPVLGALIITSPLPDEIGVGLLSIFHMKTYQFVLLSFFLKTVGIFFFLSNAHFITKLF